MNAVEKFRKRRDARLKKRFDEFKEGDHPRDENGRFTSGGGGSDTSKSTGNAAEKKTKNISVGSGKTESGNFTNDIKKTMTNNEGLDTQTGAFVKKMKEAPKGTEIKVSTKNGEETFRKTGKDTWRTSDKKLASLSEIWRSLDDSRHSGEKKEEPKETHGGDKGLARRTPEKSREKKPAGGDGVKIDKRVAGVDFYFSDFRGGGMKKMSKAEVMSKMSGDRINEGISAMFEDPNEAVEYLCGGGRIHFVPKGEKIIKSRRKAR